MTTSSQQYNRSVSAAPPALWSISATMIFASITHAYEFGAVALVVGALVIAILIGLSRYRRRAVNKPALLLYALLSLWIIGAFGVVGGLWNHAVKVAVSVANAGVLPLSLERFFMTPHLGSFIYEAVGILTFGASVVAAYFGYRFVRTAVSMTRGATERPSELQSVPDARVQPER